jgi:hypothetical protein
MSDNNYRIMTPLDYDKLDIGGKLHYLKWHEGQFHNCIECGRLFMPAVAFEWARTRQPETGELVYTCPHCRIAGGHSFIYDESMRLRPVILEDE